MRSWSRTAALALLALLAFRPSRLPAQAPTPPPAGMGPTWARIPSGTFAMGCVPGDSECLPAESPRHTVRISRPFDLMTTEVTLGLYRRRVAATAQPAWNTDARQPVVNVTWGEARSFCAAEGARLPTEAEWEYAARGGRAGERFAWGSAGLPRAGNRPAANLADESGRRHYPHMTIFPGFDDGHAFAAPAGSYPPNGYGLYDMSGNVWEWVADLYDEGYYRVSPSVDPTGPSSGTTRVVRGGSWYSDPRTARLSYRGGDEPVLRPQGDGVGFRCARDVPAERR